MISHFGSAVGRKVTPDGRFLSYPGNTVISMLDPKGEAFHHAVKWREALIHSNAASTLVALPSSSFHMTVFEGVSDQSRSPDHWTTLLPLDVPLGEVDELFE